MAVLAEEFLPSYGVSRPTTLQTATSASTIAPALDAMMTTVKETVTTMASASTSMPGLPNVPAEIKVLILIIMFIMFCAAAVSYWIHCEKEQERKAYEKLSPEEQRRYRRKKYLDERTIRWKDNYILSPDNGVDASASRSGSSTPFAQNNGRGPVEAHQLRQRILTDLGDRITNPDADDLEKQKHWQRYHVLTPQPSISKFIQKILEPVSGSEPWIKSNRVPDPLEWDQKQESPSGLSCFEKYGAYPDSLATSSAGPLLDKKAPDSLEYGGLAASIERGIEGLAKLAADKLHTEVGENPEEGLLLPVRDEEREGGRAAKSFSDLDGF
ncbi:hypothetical protein MBLNU459_g3220t1 [Dothideomycetes sp. NU459]